MILYKFLGNSSKKVTTVCESGEIPHFLLLGKSVNPPTIDNHKSVNPPTIDNHPTYKCVHPTYKCIYPTYKYVNPTYTIDDHPNYKCVHLATYKSVNLTYNR